MKTIALIDGGWCKYSSRFAAKTRLKLGYDDDVALSKHPALDAIMYNITAANLRSKLQTIQRYLGAIDNGVICKDVGKSWRADIARTVIPGSHIESGIDYKGSRHSDDPESLAAMEVLNRSFDKALNEIERHSNIQQIFGKRIEADDFMIVLSNYYAQHGYNVIIISEDADIQQAVHKFDNGGHIIIVRPNHFDKQPIVVSPASVDYLNMPKTSILATTPVFDALLKNCLDNAIVVAPQYLMFNKVMNGDVSDDITPVMLRQKTCRNGQVKNFRLTQKDIKQITEMLATKHSMGYMPREAIFEDTLDILKLAHQLLFGMSFDELPREWQQFYIDKYNENVTMVCIDNHVEKMQKVWGAIEAFAVKFELRDCSIDIPSLEILKALGS